MQNHYFAKHLKREHNTIYSIYLTPLSMDLLLYLHTPSQRHLLGYFCETKYCFYCKFKGFRLIIFLVFKMSFQIFG